MRPLHTPMHLPMWALRQGRPLPISWGKRRPQRGSRKASWALSAISRAAKLEVYGPMYSAPSSSFCKVKDSRGQASLVTLM